MESTTIKRYKGKSYSQLRERAKHYFHKFIRLRDTDDYGYGNCISSGQPLRFGTINCQAGHYKSAGKYKALEFNEDNVNLQGKSDNYFNGGNESDYRYFLVQKIGPERVSELERLALISKRTPFREDRFLMIEIIEKYKAKCKELAKTKMFEVK